MDITTQTMTTNDNARTRTGETIIIVEPTERVRRFLHNTETGTFRTGNETYHDVATSARIAGWT